MFSGRRSRWIRLAPVIIATSTALLLTGSVAQGQGKGAPAAGPTLAPHAVTILRDHWGVPHIFAAAEPDGYFGLGYSLAEDQLVRFYMAILRTRGTIAEHLSPAELPPMFRGAYRDVDQMIEEDYHTRLWGVRAHAEAAVARLDPQLRRDYEAFVAGIDAYARAHPDRVPAWAPRDLSVADIVAWPHADLWDTYQGGIPLGDCRRGGVRLAPVTGPPVPPPPEGYSNEWALMPSRTTTGGAILLSDPHGGIDGRFTHEFTLAAGPIHSAGFAHGPLMMIGRNAHLGWALTTGSPDTGDCYTITPTIPGGDTYLYDGARRGIATREISIPVKGRAPLVVKARYVTINGIASPVIGERDGRLFVAVTPYLDHLEGLHNTIYRINLAQTTDAFAQAVATGGMFPENLLAADTRGQLIYIHAGLVPVRPDPSIDWTRPVSGNESRFAWRGLHPTSDLVTIRSPASGYLQNNNTDPRFMDVVRPKETVGVAQYLLADGLEIPTDTMSNRGKLFLDAVARGRKFSESDALALAMDTRSLFADRWLALLRGAPRTAAGSDDTAFLADLLSFDGRLDAHSTAALKYIYWREALRRLLTRADGESLRGVIIDREPAPARLVAKAALALRDAAQELAARPNGLRRLYGDEFRLATGAGSEAMSGGFLRTLGDRSPAPDCAAAQMLCPESLLAVNYARAPDGLRYAVAGTRIMRLDFLSPTGIRSFTYQNPGISDDRASPHSTDQARALVSKQKLKPVLFDYADAARDTVARETIDTTRR